MFFLGFRHTGCEFTAYGVGANAYRKKRGLFMATEMHPGLTWSSFNFCPESVQGREADIL